MHRRHSMPFGASCCEQGITFRLWAPAARKVDVHIQRTDKPLLLPMERSLSGWYELNDRSRRCRRSIFLSDRWFAECP